MVDKMKRPFFSIILPTYNRLNSLKKILLPSLEKQDFLNYELIVVDDGSSDGTEEFFKSDGFNDTFPNCSKRLKYLKNKKNLGSPKSRNIGFLKSKGKWIFMTEDDLQIRDKEFLKKSMEIILISTKKDNKIAVICPKREEFMSKGYYRNWNKSFINYGFLSKEIYHDPAQEYEGYIINAQACSFIKSSIAKIVLYDTKSFKYFREESDFYERIKKIGYKLYYVGDKLKTYHRMDLVQSGGNRKHSVSLKNELKYIQSHYHFLKRNFSNVWIGIIFYILVREIKNISNLIKLNFVKNILSLIRI